MIITLVVNLELLKLLSIYKYMQNSRNFIQGRFLRASLVFRQFDSQTGENRGQTGGIFKLAKLILPFLRQNQAKQQAYQNVNSIYKVY